MRAELMEESSPGELYKEGASTIVANCDDICMRVTRLCGLNGSDNHEEVCWNEKFTFEFSFSELKNLTHLKFRILDKEYLSDGGFVGETTVYLEGIIMEGNDKGFIELRPAPYNVVLEDDTYKGQIKIVLKFVSNKVLQSERRVFVAADKEPGQSIYGTIKNLWKIPWCRFLYFYKNINPDDKQTEY
ncbi:hypothetical protein RJ639_025747 [Escallonia herrerae]|uniref:C2 domain-containing protein n=1 Tax=Escallonia herrerae TaxID=1293975 RepID=A0AA88SQD8_9ASTE|nr:hypothetical protein RJ639_025747 [Escallonia herrerae]